MVLQIFLKIYFKNKNRKKEEVIYTKVRVLVFGLLVYLNGDGRTYSQCHFRYHNQLRLLYIFSEKRPEELINRKYKWICINQKWIIKVPKIT